MEQIFAPPACRGFSSEDCGGQLVDYLLAACGGVGCTCLQKLGVREVVLNGSPKVLSGWVAAARAIKDVANLACVLLCLFRMCTSLTCSG